MTKKDSVQVNALDTIGKRIAEKRKAKGISQAQLGKKVSASQSIIAKIEQDKRNVQNDMLIKIANELGTDADYLLRGVEARNISSADDLHLDNESINNLRNYLESDQIMELDSAKEAVNFFLSNRDGFSIMSQIYAYLFSDCSFIIDSKKKQIGTDSLRIPLNSHLPKNNTTVSYHLTSEAFSDMILQRIMFNLKQWRIELNNSQKGDK